MLIKVRDGWRAADRRYLSEGSLALIDTQPDYQILKEVTAELVV